MSEQMLQQGDKIKAIYGPDQENGAIYFTTRDKPGNVRSIRVELVTGQMSMVPWAKVVTVGGGVIMVNLALMEMVEYG